MTSHEAFELALFHQKTTPSDLLRGDMVKSAPRFSGAERFDFVFACVTTSIACLAGIAAVIA